MDHVIKQAFLYSKLLWHHLAYFAVGMETERLHSNLGLAYFDFGDFSRAVFHFEKSEKMRHRDDRAFARYNSYYLGYSYMNLCRYPEAIEHLEGYLRVHKIDKYTQEAIDWCRRELAGNNSETGPSPG